MTFQSGRWDIDILVNDADRPDETVPARLPADRLFALVILWSGRINDHREKISRLTDPEEQAREQALADSYLVATDELIQALDAVYPNWRNEGMQKLIPEFKD